MARPVAVANYVMLAAAGLLQLAWLTEPCDALRMINLDVPQMAVQGDSIQLSCSYSLTTGGGERRDPAVAHHDLDEQTEGPRARPSAPTGRRSTASGRELSSAVGDRLSTGNRETANFKLAAERADNPTEQLYAIKWYKDEREFFRYVSQDWPHKQALPMESLHIDVDKSDNQTVALRNVSLRTSGLFRCEVSTDAPSFLTKSIERKVLIHSLPTEGPTIELPPARSPRRLHYLDDQLELSCVSRESKPPAQLDWILNERINLTAGLPHNPGGQPLLRVSNERLVRVSNIPHMDNGQTDIKLAGSELPRLTSATYILNQTDWDGAGGVAAKLIDNLQAPQTLALSSDDLDKTPEVTLSRLNFSVDVDLLRLLLESSGSARPGRVTEAGTNWRTRKLHSQTGQYRGANLRSIQAAADEVNSTTKEVRQARSMAPRYILRIRCVARVLHLRMSDDLRLNIVNRTRGAIAAQDGSSLGLSRHEVLDSNSATRIGQYDPRVWLIVFSLIAMKLDGIILSNVGDRWMHL